MWQAGSLIWLVVGASLVGVVTRVTIPPATWLALTLYARTGDLFAWLCVAGLVAALGIAAADPRTLSQVTPATSPAANRDLAHT
jgi:hypothetical protein